MSKTNAEKQNFMMKISEIIVDKRNLFFLLFIFACVFSIVASSWVKVEDDITMYLPKSTETRTGLDIMNREFITYGTAEVMVSNIGYKRAEQMAKDIESIDGVSSVEFENNDEHFKGTSAMFTVTFDGTSDDEVSIKALNKIRDMLSDYDIYVSSEVGDSATDALNQEMSVILVIAAIIIVLVLLFTSQSYAEVPVLIITFGVAALLNKGTNFMLGKISFISNSVSIVLQLALAIDYAIILCHRYTEERVNMPQREAVITALSKAIPEISSSCLTTVSGLAALITMEFKIGQDLAFVLIKAIMFSLLSVFVLMPGLLMLFGKSMERTKHKNFVPNIYFIGKFDLKTKKIMPAIFLMLMIAGCVLSNMCPYVFGQNSLPTIKKSETQIAKDKIKATFKQENTLALVVPAGNYEKEAALLSEMEQCPEVDSTLGLANTEAMHGYMLTESISPREFSELTEVDYEAAMALYAAYAVKQEDYGKIVNNLDAYSVPIIDMLVFLHDEIDEGYVSLDDETVKEVDENYDKIVDAKKQLQSEKYSRMLVNLNIDEEGDETFAFLDKMHKIMGKYYDSDAYIVGNSTSDYDLSKSFARDNIIISVMSALFVVIIILFTFNSAGLSVLLILIIQGSIWINFSFPYMMNRRLFFLGYLIVSSIQMGANIDYAIVISSRYTELKKTMNVHDAIVETINQAFPTIVTSGTIMAAAGALIGCISTNGIIASVGECIGRGTVISIILVMCVLPQILILGNSIVERTSFAIKKPAIRRSDSGTVFVNGRLRGRVSGIIDADVHGVISGEFDAIVNSNNIKEISGDDNANQATYLPQTAGGDASGGEKCENRDGSAKEEKTDE
ncbi:MAG: MMPL family transporter [Firmicutes bacterium]|nr:MMPL family transporter [Bacillota bacterium]